MGRRPGAGLVVVEHDGVGPLEAAFACVAARRLPGTAPGAGIDVLRALDAALERPEPGAVAAGVAPATCRRARSRALLDPPLR